MMSYAVTSFPNQSLDEWALDYPQQVVMSVLHLVLSHEINEVLEGEAPEAAVQVEEEPKKDLKDQVPDNLKKVTKRNTRDDLDPRLGSASGETRT
jgi:hypothetical protein